MSEVSVEREIAAAPEDVWELISDVTRMGDWSPECTGGTWLGDASGPAVGARFRGTNKAGWRRWWTTATVTEADPGKSFVFKVASGPMPIATWGYQIAPTDGGCRVTESFVDRRSNLAIRLSPMVSGIHDRDDHNQRSMETTLERLAAAAEAG